MKTCFFVVKRSCARETSLRILLIVYTIFRIFPTIMDFLNILFSFNFAYLTFVEARAFSLRENKSEPLIILLITYELPVILWINC